MSSLLIGFCLGLLPALIAALLIIRKVNGESALLRERLAAEEASRRHFMDLATRQEATIALMYAEQKRLEVENTLLRSRALVTDSTAAAA
jgi:hypothetical protein